MNLKNRDLYIFSTALSALFFIFSTALFASFGILENTRLHTRDLTSFLVSSLYMFSCVFFISCPWGLRHMCFIFSRHRGLLVYYAFPSLVSLVSQHHCYIIFCTRLELVPFQSLRSFILGYCLEGLRLCLRTYQFLSLFIHFQFLMSLNHLVHDFWL